MTDRVSKLTVILKKDMRIDDALRIADLIALIEPVAACELGEPRLLMEVIERARIRQEVTLEAFQKLCYGTEASE